MRSPPTLPPPQNLERALVSGPHSLLSEFEIHSVQRCVLVDY